MPYARTRKSTYRRKRPATTRRKSLPAAVRPKKTIKRVVARNYRKTNRLSRKVNFLMQARWGNIQTGVHRWSSGLNITSETPIVMDISDFTVARSTATTPPVTVENARVFQMVPGTLGSPDTIVPETYWTNGNYTYSVFNQYQANDQCGDTGYYKPLYGGYTLEFTVTTTNTSRPPRIRIDMFTSTGKGLIPNNFSATNPESRLRFMPWALTQMKDMADLPFLMNSGYFKKLSTKVLVCNRNTACSGASGMQQEYRTFHMIRPKKVIHQNNTRPGIPGTTTAEVSSQLTNWGTYGPQNRTDQKSMIWLMISTDADTPDTRIRVQCSRKCKWRDPVGGSQL